MKPEIMNFFSMCWVSSCSRIQNSLWENWEHCALEMKEHTKGWLLFCWGTYKDHRLIFLSLFSWCGTELSTALQWLPGVSYAVCAKYSSCALLTGFFACEIRINFGWFSEIPFIMELWIFWCEFPFFPSFQGPGTMTWAKPPTVALSGTCSEQLLIIFSVFLSHCLLLNTMNSLLIS